MSNHPFTCPHHEILKCGTTRQIFLDGQLFAEKIVPQKLLAIAAPFAMAILTKMQRPTLTLR
ncbi:hypothetical protein [Mesorhizobium sp. 128a]